MLIAAPFLFHWHRLILNVMKNPLATFYDLNPYYIRGNVRITVQRVELPALLF